MLEESANGESCNPEEVLEESLQELGLQQKEIKEAYVREAAEDGGVDAGLVLGGERTTEFSRAYAEAQTVQEKSEISETLGVEGAENLCMSMGYQPLLVDDEKAVRTGFDSCWIDPKNGDIVVIEAKGNKSPCGTAYGGEKEGTLGWVMAAAVSMQISPGTSRAEKQAAQMVVEAFTKGNLRIETIRTTYSAVSGPGVIEIENCDSVSEV